MASGALPVLYLIESATAVTGAFRSAQNVARALKDHAHVVLVLPKTSHIADDMLSDFWRVEQMSLQNPSFSTRKLFPYLCSLLRTSMLLRSRMKADNSCHLIINDFYLLYGVAMRIWGYRGTVLQWVRCDPERFAQRFARPFLQLIQYSATYVIAVSEFIASRLPPSTKNRVLYDGIDAPTASQLAQRDSENFIFIGNYIEGKGQDVAIRALALVVSQHPSATLHFYGSDMGLEKNRTYRHSLEALARELAIAEHVYFGDFITDCTSAYANALAALNFSISESFSMTTLEASAAGLPVIATRCGGPEEIIVDGETGYLIPVGDHHAAASMMLKLLTDTETARAFGIAGCARCAKKFSLRAFQAQLIDLLGLAR